jgi:hypothetical protein
MAERKLTIKQVLQQTLKMLRQMRIILKLIFITAGQKIKNINSIKNAL